MKHGASLYKQGMKALNMTFNMKASQVVVFQKELADHAKMMGWDKGTQNIMKFKNKDNKDINLIPEYGQINAATLKTACEPFIFAEGANSQKRAAQNNEQMWCCLYNLLSKHAKATLLTYRQDYEVSIGGDDVIVTALMYKTIMQLATLDGNATVAALRANLDKLT